VKECQLHLVGVGFVNGDSSRGSAHFDVELCLRDSDDAGLFRTAVAQAQRIRCDLGDGSMVDVAVSVRPGPLAPEDATIVFHGVPQKWRLAGFTRAVLDAAGFCAVPVSYEYHGTFCTSDGLVFPGVHRHDIIVAHVRPPPSDARFDRLPRVFRHDLGDPDARSLVRISVRGIYHDPPPSAVTGSSAHHSTPPTSSRRQRRREEQRVHRSDALTLAVLPSFTPASSSRPPPPSAILINPPVQLTAPRVRLAEPLDAVSHLGARCAGDRTGLGSGAERPTRRPRLESFTPAPARSLPSSSCTAMQESLPLPAPGPGSVRDTVMDNAHDVPVEPRLDAVLVDTPMLPAVPEERDPTPVPPADFFDDPIAGLSVAWIEEDAYLVQDGQGPSGLELRNVIRRAVYKCRFTSPREWDSAAGTTVGYLLPYTLRAALWRALAAESLGLVSFPEPTPPSPTDATLLPGAAFATDGAGCPAILPPPQLGLLPFQVAAPASAPADADMIVAAPCDDAALEMVPSPHAAARVPMSASVPASSRGNSRQRPAHQVRRTSRNSQPPTAWYVGDGTGRPSAHGS
jgi:hypothetical protein